MNNYQTQMGHKCIIIQENITSCDDTRTHLNWEVENRTKRFTFLGTPFSL